jgi:hypothetical protein
MLWCFRTFESHVMHTARGSKGIPDALRSGFPSVQQGLIDGVADPHPQRVCPARSAIPGLSGLGDAEAGAGLAGGRAHAAAAAAAAADVADAARAGAAAVAARRRRGARQGRRVFRQPAEAIDRRWQHLEMNVPPDLRGSPTLPTAAKSGEAVAAAWIGAEKGCEHFSVISAGNGRAGSLLSPSARTDATGGQAALQGFQLIVRVFPPCAVYRIKMYPRMVRGGGTCWLLCCLGAHGGTLALEGSRC